MGETSAKQESLFGEGRQASLTGSHPGFRTPGQATRKDVPRWDGQRGECGTTRDFGPARDSAAMFGFGLDVSGMNGSGFKPTIPVLNGKLESFSRRKKGSVIYSRRYGFDAVFTKADEGQGVKVGDPDCPMERFLDEFGVDIVISHLNAW